MYDTCPNTQTIFTLASPYSDDVRITWKLTNSIIGSIVSGQETEEIEIQWGDQAGNTDIEVKIEVCGINLSSSSSITLAAPNSPDFSTTPSLLCSESFIIFNGRISVQVSSPLTAPRRLTLVHKQWTKVPAEG